MDDKTIIDITNLDAENMQKILQNELLHTERSFFITHQFFPKKNIRNFFLKDWRRTMVL